MKFLKIIFSITIVVVFYYIYYIYSNKQLNNVDLLRIYNTRKQPMYGVLEKKPYMNYTNIVKVTLKDKKYAKDILKSLGVNKQNDTFKNIEIIRKYVQGLEYIEDNYDLNYTNSPTLFHNGRYNGLREPITTIVDKGGDCEDKTALAIMLYEGMGIETAIIMRRGKLSKSGIGHVYLALPSNLIKKYIKSKDYGTFNMDGIMWKVLDPQNEALFGDFEGIKNIRSMSYSEAYKIYLNNKWV